MNLIASQHNDFEDQHKTILELSAEEAKDYLFRSENYCTLDLPAYFDFNEVLVEARSVLTNGPTFSRRSVRTANRNYLIRANKDGALNWRPMQLVNPFLYARLVLTLTKPESWSEIVNRFQELKTEKIYCMSVPLYAPYEGNSVRHAKRFHDKRTINNWWKRIEEESVKYSLEFSCVAITDIADCYSNIYTHSLAWAMHGREVARANRNDRNFLGNKIDALLQDLHEGQTNGIPQGNMVSDLLAELVLAYVDFSLAKRLEELGVEDYKILRYRDDYKIFTKSPKEASGILVTLAGVLADLNFKLNSSKTKISTDIVGSTIKESKIHAKLTARKFKSDFDALLFMKEFSRLYPNDNQMKRMLMELSKNLDETFGDTEDAIPRAEVLVAMTVDLMVKNPNLYPQCVGLLSRLLNNYDETLSDVLKAIENKFANIPNIEFLQIWLQRLAIGYKDEMNWHGATSAICEYVAEYVENLDNDRKPSLESIWKNDFLNSDIIVAFNSLSILNEQELRQARKIIPKHETSIYPYD